MSKKLPWPEDLRDYQIAIINHTSSNSEADELTTAINKLEYLVFNRAKWASEHPDLDSRESMLKVLENAKVIIIFWDEQFQNDLTCGEFLKYVRENRLAEESNNNVAGVDMVSNVALESFNDKCDYENKNEYAFYKQYGAFPIKHFGSQALIKLLIENIERRSEIRKTYSSASQHNKTSNKSNEIVALAAQETEYGQDHLGIAKDAIALARLIATKNLSPPFTVGLLGGWGSGKSFTFNLIEQELINIQHKYRKDRKKTYGYAGHIYVVRFDAWTFSKGDIWSSLMYSILTQLNEQVQVEEILRKHGREGYSLLEECGKLRANDIEYLKEYGSKKLDKDMISKALADIVQEEYEDLEVDLKNKRSKLERKQSDLRKMDRDLFDLENEKAATATRDKIHKKVESRYGAEVKEQILNYFKEAKQDVSTHIEAEVTSLIPKEPIETFVNSNKMLWTAFKQGNFTTFAIFLIVVSIAVPGVIIYLRGKFDAILVSIISVITPILSAIGRFVMKYNQIISPLIEEVSHLNELQGKITDETNKNFEDEIEKKKKDRLKHLEASEELKKDISAKEKQKRLVKGKNLKEFLEAQDVSGYESNLNVVHQAKKDLDLLSNALLNQRNKKQFPRGKARIVLFIDDLDRCNDKMVVETLEALKLLVRTEVFVVAVAIDMQYVTLALENNYKGVLKRGTHPSGLDYLEKIIQLPYRVSPLYSRDAIYSYVTSLTRINEETSDSDANLIEKKSESTVDVQENGRNLLQKKTEINAGVQENKRHEGKVIKGHEEGEKSPNESITSPTVFNENDEKILIRIFKEVRVSPRAVKRVINVLRIMKIVCNKDIMSNDEILEALILILAFSAALNPKTRAAMCDVFARFEEAYMEKDYYGGGTTFFEILFGKELDDNNHLKKEHSISLSKLKKIEVNIKNFGIVVESIHKVRCFSFVGESLDYDAGSNFKH